MSTIPGLFHDVDDNGTGTLGTVRDDAWLQAVFAAVAGMVDTVLTSSTVTGTVNNWAPTGFTSSKGHCSIWWSGASNVTFTGLTAGTNGQLFWLRNASASSKLSLSHNSGSSSSGNKFSNIITSGATPIGPGGAALYRYDSSSGFWVLVYHEQGGALTWTPTDASGAALSLTVTDALYIVRGRKVFAEFNITYPSTANGSVAKLGGLPFTAAAANFGANVNYSTVGSGFYVLVASSTTEMPIYNLSGVSLANSALSTKNIAATAIYFTT